MISKKFVSYLTTFALVIMGIVSLFPIYMAIINSFKSQGEIFGSALSLPSTLNFENYIVASQRIDLLGSALNTLIVTAIGLIGIVICGSLAGYKLARTRSKLSNVIFVLFMASMLVPFHAIMISLTRITTTLSMQNSLVGLGFIYIGLGVNMAIFLYHGFVKTIPLELEEAARIDGCNELQIFVKIIFPLLKPISATILILNVLWLWNDFLLPMLMLTDVQNHTMMLSINALFGEFNTEWPLVLAALILTSIPVVLFYIIFQKHILKGIAEGALKS